MTKGYRPRRGKWPGDRERQTLKRTGSFKPEGAKPGRPPAMAAALGKNRGAPDLVRLLTVQRPWYLALKLYADDSVLDQSPETQVWLSRKLKPRAGYQNISPPRRNTQNSPRRRTVGASSCQLQLYGWKLRPKAHTNGMERTSPEISSLAGKFREGRCTRKVH